MGEFEPNGFSTGCDFVGLGLLSSPTYGSLKNCGGMIAVWPYLRSFERGAFLRKHASALQTQLVGVNVLRHYIDREKLGSWPEKRDDGSNGSVRVFEEKRVAFTFDDFEFCAGNCVDDALTQIRRRRYIECPDACEYGDT